MESDARHPYRTVPYPIVPTCECRVECMLKLSPLGPRGPPRGCAECESKSILAAPAPRRTRAGRSDPRPGLPVTLYRGGAPAAARRRVGRPRAPDRDGPSAMRVPTDSTGGGKRQAAARRFFKDD